MSRRLRPGKTPRYQGIQVYIKVHAPGEILNQLTPEFFRDVLTHIIAGDEVPAVSVSSVIWTRDTRVYSYAGEDAIDALRKAVDVFGMHKVVRAIRST